MTELKTLKDMCEKPYGDECGYCHRCKYHEELKEEAIKWIKNYEYEAVPFEYTRDLLPKIKWIKHFFNITEEDLK